MREMQELRAEPRAKTGKGPAYQIRRRGLIPGVVYGGKAEPQNVQLEERAFVKVYSAGAMLSTLFMLELDGKKTRVIPRQIQIDPVTDRPVHVDFLRLEKGARIAIAIPVHFKNHGESPGLKRGGVLNVVLHEVELYCPVDNIPEFIEGDLAGLDIHDSMHISAIPLPAGVRPVNAREDFTVATIVVPTTYVEEVVAAAVPAEGEVPAEGTEAVPGAEGAAPAAGAAAAPAAEGEKGVKAAPGAAPAKAAAPAKGEKPAGEKKK
jgi:large subunit ribosomal protein L25